MTASKMLAVVVVVLLASAVTVSEAGTFRVGWLATTCLSFDSTGFGKTSGERLSSVAERAGIDVSGTSRNGSETMKSSTTLTDYLMQSWTMVLRDIKEAGMLEGHELS